MKSLPLVLVGVTTLFAEAIAHAQFNIPKIPGIPGIPSTPSAPSAPNPSSINKKTVDGVVEMAKGATGVSLADEMKIGGAVAVDIVSRNGGLVKDDAINQRVILIGKSLSRSCARPELNFRFGVLNSDSVNAYSAPGGYVFITRGLYNSVKDDAELAAVLAHEISHIVKRHALKVISRSQFMKGLFDAGGSVSNVSGFDQGIAAITDTILSKGFDPSAEFEADKDGRALASKVGYDRAALLDFLQELYKEKGDAKDMFPTHPPLSHRIERLESK